MRDAEEERLRKAKEKLEEEKRKKEEREQAIKNAEAAEAEKASSRASVAQDAGAEEDWKRWTAKMNVCLFLSAHTRESELTRCENSRSSPKFFLPSRRIPPGKRRVIWLSARLRPRSASSRTSADRFMIL
jgi:hypothetical protein